MLQMNTSEFLGQVQRINAGGNGFLKHVPITAGDWTVASGASPGTTLMDGSGPVWSAGTSTALYYTFSVPDDYDQDKDELWLEILAERDTGTDAPTFKASTAATRYRAGAASVAMTTAQVTTSTTATLDATATIPKWLKMDLRGLGLRPRDAFMLTIEPSTHATDGVSIRFAALKYASTLVAYALANR